MALDELTRADDTLVETEQSTDIALATNIELFRRFLHRPFRSQLALFNGFLRGMRLKRLFDESDWPIVDAEVQIRKGNGQIAVGRFAKFEGGCQIAVHSPTSLPAYFRVGQASSIGPQTTINVAQSLEIGDRCLISWNCDIMDTDFHRIQFTPDDVSRSVTAPIRIKDDVWIGARCIILKGVTIGPNSVIGAGSVVTTDVPPNSLAAGNPARVIRPITKWTRRV